MTIKISPKESKKLTINRPPKDRTPKNPIYVSVVPLSAKNAAALLPQCFDFSLSPEGFDFWNRTLLALVDYGSRKGQYLERSDHQARQPSRLYPRIIGNPNQALKDGALKKEFLESIKPEICAKTYRQLANIDWYDSGESRVFWCHIYSYLQWYSVQKIWRNNFIPVAQQAFIKGENP